MSRGMCARNDRARYESRQTIRTIANMLGGLVHLIEHEMLTAMAGEP